MRHAIVVAQLSPAVMATDWVPFVVVEQGACPELVEENKP
jgi:hypothetical protein